MAEAAGAYQRGGLHAREGFSAEQAGVRQGQGRVVDEGAQGHTRHEDVSPVAPTAAPATLTDSPIEERKRKLYDEGRR